MQKLKYMVGYIQSPLECNPERPSFTLCNTMSNIKTSCILPTKKISMTSYMSQNRHQLFTYVAITDLLVGLLAIFRKASPGFRTSVLQTVRSKHLGSRCVALCDTLYWGLPLTLVEKIQF